MMNRTVFFDRDGTLIEDSGYPCNFRSAAVFPGAVEAVKRINDWGLLAIIVTNQSAVARGICSEDQVRRFHEDLTGYFQAKGARIDAAYYCPFLPEGTVAAYRIDHPWRKPSPGMLLAAAEEWRLDLAKSFLIGDSPRDMQAGKSTGCRTIQLISKDRPAPVAPEADETAGNILEAIDQIAKWIGM